MNKEFYVIYEQNCVQDDFDPGNGEPYNHSYHRVYKSEVLGITDETPKHYCDWTKIVKEIKDENQKDFFVIAVIYSTGNTFGRSEGHISIVDICESLGDAEEIITQIKDKKYNEKGYNDWEGYFENLTDVYAEKFTLNQTQGKYRF